MIPIIRRKHPCHPILGQIVVALGDQTNRGRIQEEEEEIEIIIQVIHRKFRGRNHHHPRGKSGGKDMEEILLVILPVSQGKNLKNRARGVTLKSRMMDIMSTNKKIEKEESHC